MIINYRPTFLIVDGHNFFIRSYVVNPALDQNGSRIGGTLGMLTGLRKLAERFKPTAMFVVWDGKGGSQRRRAIRAEYKENRRVRLNRGREGDADFSETAREDLENMDHQMELARKYIDTLGVQQLAVPAVEADDMISLLCGFLEGNKVIVSTDADLLQLVTEEVTVYNPVKDKVYRGSDVLSERGCLATNYALMKAVCGDKGDNVEGVEGIGPKTLVKLVPKLAEETIDMPALMATLEERSQIVDRKGNPDAMARRAQSILDRKDHVLENLQLVSLHTPLISADAARSGRSLALSPPQYRAATIRMEAVQDGLQLREDFDKPFIMLASRTSMWAKKQREKSE